MTRIALKRLLIGVIFLGLSLAAAIVSWGIRTKPCRDFRLQVEALYRSLPRDRLRTEEEQEEALKILQRACRGELERCAFRICSDRKTVAALGANSSIPTSPTSFDGGSTTFRPDSGGEVHSPSTTPLYPRTLEWLDRNLSCSDFLQQINTRYPAISRFTELSPDKQEELKVVLRVACSARFKECNFSACRVAADPVKP